MNQELAEMPLDDVSPDDLTPLQEKPDAVPVPHLLVPHLNETAILLDIDGTLLDLARVQEGDLPRDPAQFARRVTTLLGSSLGQ